MISKEISIHIKEIEKMKLINLDIKDLSKEESICILSMCLNKILNDCEVKSGVVITNNNSENL